MAFAICNGADYNVALANHGLDALGLLAAGRFDLVVVDVRSPERDGVALANIVRERPANDELSMIALVEDVTVAEHAAMRAAGIDRVLAMPSSLTVVRRAIEDTLRVPGRVPGLLEAYAKAYAHFGGPTFLVRWERSVAGREPVRYCLN